MMKKIAFTLCAIALALTFALPASAATSNPPTGDMMVWVLVALIVAACAIIGTIIFSRKKK